MDIPEIQQIALQSFWIAVPKLSELKAIGEQSLYTAWDPGTMYLLSVPGQQQNFMVKNIADWLFAITKFGEPQCAGIYHAKKKKKKKCLKMLWGPRNLSAVAGCYHTWKVQILKVQIQTIVSTSWTP